MAGEWMFIPQNMETMVLAHPTMSQLIYHKSAIDPIQSPFLVVKPAFSDGKTGVPPW